MSHDSESAAVPRLSLRAILRDAFVLPWKHRADVARVTGLPLLAAIGCTLAWDAAELNRSGAAQWTLYFLYLIASSWLAISVHRLVLLDGIEAHSRLDSKGLRRLGMFVGWMIGVSLLVAVIVVVLMSVTIPLFARYVPAGEAPPPEPQLLPWLNALVVIAAVWVVGRLSLMFPSIAIDQRLDPIGAWLTSRGNGWKLAVIVGGLPLTLQLIVELLYRADAGWIEFGLLHVVLACFMVVEVVALSLAYGVLTTPAPPPTDPPG